MAHPQKIIGTWFIPSEITELLNPESTFYMRCIYKRESHDDCPCEHRLSPNEIWGIEFNITKFQSGHLACNLTHRVHYYCHLIIGSLCLSHQQSPGGICILQDWIEICCRWEIERYKAEEERLEQEQIALEQSENNNETGKQDWYDHLSSVQKVKEWEFRYQHQSREDLLRYCKSREDDFEDAAQSRDIHVRHNAQLKRTITEKDAEIAQYKQQLTSRPDLSQMMKGLAYRVIKAKDRMHQMMFLDEEKAQLFSEDFGSAFETRQMVKDSLKHVLHELDSQV